MGTGRCPLLWASGPFLDSPENEKPFVNLLTACPGKPIFKYVFKATKIKLTVKFDDLNSLRSWDTEEIVTPENGP